MMTSILNYIIAFDFNVQKLILFWRQASWDGFFFLITYLGHWLVIGFIFIILSLLLKKHKKSALIVPFLVSISGSAILTLFIKIVVGRNRPIGDIVLYAEKLPSFPSAHAALVFTLFGFLIYCLWRFKLSVYIKAPLILILVLNIILVGFSRLYLGVHFFSDVLGGYLIGLLWVLVAMHISRTSFSS